jgi:tRNA pseudouridine38-40 synthase
MRIALGVEYDGSRYCGWQSQPDMLNVQDTLASALSSVADEHISIIAAGRTDTGVHALEQVIHFDSNSLRPQNAWVRGTNALLPKDIAVLWAHTVTDDFHARFSAQARSYQYVMINRPTRSAVHQGKVGWFHLPLDVAAMRSATQYLLGEHNFSAFRSSQCQAKTPVKNLMQFDIRQDGDTIIFDLTANAFLHHMVRNIIGCLVYIGKGKYPPHWLLQVLESGDRSQAAPTFAPDGLYLRHIIYDAKWALPQGTMPPRYQTQISR